MRTRSCIVEIIAVVLLSSLCAQAQKALFDQARRTQASGDFPSAERLYRKFIQANPESVAAWANLGVVLARQGHFSAAIEAYASALKIDPNALPVLVNLGLSYYKMSDWRHAADTFEKVLARNPEDRRSRQLFAVTLSQLGDYQRSASQYEKLMPSSDPSILVGLATCYKDTGREADSEQILTYLLKTQGNSPQVYYLFGLTAYARKEYPKAIENLQKCLASDPKLVDARFYLGAAFFKQGDLPFAVREWKDVAKSNPEYFPAFFAAGALLVDSNSARDAQPLLEHAYALKSQDFAVQLALGKDYLELSQPHKALPLLESATHLNPKSQPASFLLARTLKQLGRNKEAAAEFRRCSGLFDDGVGVLGDPIKVMRQNEP